MKYVSGYSSAIAAKVIVRLVEGVHLIWREEMAEVHLTGQHHARAVGLFETSLNHRTRCCKSLGIGVPVFLPLRLSSIPGNMNYLAIVPVMRGDRTNSSP